MKKILSIDLSILMAPYLAFYDKIAMSTNHRRQAWEIIDDMFDASDFTINEEYKNQITEVIKTYKDSVNKIYIGDDHSKILSVFSDLGVDYSEIEVYNIDYNHDINYGLPSGLPDKLIKNNMQKNAIHNWAGLLLLNDGVYHWYSGKGAFIGKSFLNDSSAIKVSNDFKRELIENGFPLDLTFDAIFISKSLQCIPKKYDEIVNDIINIISEDKKIILE